MASSLLALLDDISLLMDDVATLTKIATKKTSGVIADDLALNAQHINGMSPDRELPIIWAVFKGALLNKAIIIPVALGLSAFLPWLITPLLMMGGAFLCFEGVEKTIEKLFHKKEKKEVAFTSEAEKIKGAVKTDFILSAEIIVIALGTMFNSHIVEQVIALSVIGILITIGIYGLVGLIIKIDDAGLFLVKKENIVLRHTGQFLLNFAPILMKILGIVGTIAMFLVGGGIIHHGLSFLSNFSNPIIANFGEGSFLYSLLGLGFDLSTGVATGLIVSGLVYLFKKIKG